MNTALPADMCLVLDPAARRIDRGSVLVGGSPVRLLRLSPTGAAVLDDLVAGEPVGTAPARSRLARRLLDAGLAHPRPIRSPFTAAQVTVVVPAHDSATELDRTLRTIWESVASGPSIAAVVVVDDASADASAFAAIVEGWPALDVRLVRRERNGGPAAARNTGLDHVRTPLVAFVDCDVEPEPGWLDTLLVHFDDPAVAMAAPRVRALAGDRLLDRFEHDRSPLDLGAAEARVGPGSRVAYVPSTTLVARTDVVEQVGRFDETLRVGEDVDLVWRVIGAGHTVRYEPAAVVRHPPRASLRSWARQRYDYGTSAASLDERHPGAVPPLALSGWTAGAWALAMLGHPLAGAALGAGAAAALPRRLHALDHPWAESARLAGAGQLYAWRPVASAITRTWWPVALAASLVSRPVRRSVVAAVVVPPAIDWLKGDRSVGPLAYLGLRVADDLAYGAGVWAGCLRARHSGPLRPALSSWPGRSPQPEPTPR